MKVVTRDHRSQSWLLLDVFWRRLVINDPMLSDSALRFLSVEAAESWCSYRQHFLTGLRNPSDDGLYYIMLRMSVDWIDQRICGIISIINGIMTLPAEFDDFVTLRSIHGEKFGFRVTFTLK